MSINYISSQIRSYGQWLVSTCFGFQPGLCRDLWNFDTVTETWHWVSDRGPSARAYHVAAWDPMNLALWIHGGKDGVPRRDLWRFDSLSSSWSLIHQVDEYGPSRRYDHVGAWDTSSMSLWVHGGYEGNMLRDLWRFTVPTTTTFASTGTLTTMALTFSLRSPEDSTALSVICLLVGFLIFLAVLLISVCALKHCKGSAQVVVLPTPAPPPPPPPLPPSQPVAACPDNWTIPIDTQQIHASPEHSRMPANSHPTQANTQPVHPCQECSTQPATTVSIHTGHEYLTLPANTQPLQACFGCVTLPADWQPMTLCPQYARLPINSQVLISPADPSAAIPVVPPSTTPALDLSIPTLQRLAFSFCLQLDSPPSIKRTKSLFLYPDRPPLLEPFQTECPAQREWIFHLHEPRRTRQTPQSMPTLPQPKQPGPTMPSPVLNMPRTIIPDKRALVALPLMDPLPQQPPDRHCGSTIIVPFDFSQRRTVLHSTERPEVQVFASPSPPWPVHEPVVVVRPCTPTLSTIPNLPTIPVAKLFQFDHCASGIPIPTSQRPKAPKAIQKAPLLRRPGKSRARQRPRSLTSTLGGPWWTCPETPGPGAYDPEHPGIFGRIPGRDPSRFQRRDGRDRLTKSQSCSRIL